MHPPPLKTFRSGKAKVRSTWSPNKQAPPESCPRKERRKRPTDRTKGGNEEKEFICDFENCFACVHCASGCATEQRDESRGYDLDLDLLDLDLLDLSPHACHICHVFFLFLFRGNLHHVAADDDVDLDRAIGCDEILFWDIESWMVESE